MAVATQSYAQNITEVLQYQQSENPLNVANKLFSLRQYYEAVPYYKKALQDTELAQKPDLYTKLTIALYQVRHYEQARKYILLRAAHPRRLSIDEALLASRVYLSNGNIAEAKEQIRYCLANNKAKDDTLMHQIQRLQTTIHYIENAKEQKVYRIQEMPIQINKKHQTRGGKWHYDTLWFSASDYQKEKRKQYWEELRGTYQAYYKLTLYVSSYRNGSFSSRQALAVPRKYSTYDLSDPCPLPTGKSILFSLCRDDQSSCQIATGELNQNKLSHVEILPEPVNLPGSHSLHPFYHSKDDTAILFFSSQRPGGQGGYDLYYCYPDKKLHCKEVHAAGKTINTPGNEITPFFLDDTLYLSSDYHPGFGHYDVFKSHFTKQKQFSKPVNLGKGINSLYDDYYFIRWDEKDSLHKKTYGSLASNRRTNHQSQHATRNDRLFLIEKENRHQQTTKNEKPNSDSLDTQSDTKKKDSKIIYFETGSASLDSSSKIMLDSLASYLIQQNQVKLIINGHTDHTGSEKINIHLSQQRAHEVTVYLTNKGIPLHQIEATGYGYKYPHIPKSENLDEKKNRRVEITWTKKQSK